MTELIFICSACSPRCIHVDM